MYSIIAYSTYLLFSLITILKVGKTLHKNGKTFLFAECPDHSLSDSANNFLYIGYCLVNTGFAFYFLNTKWELTDFKSVLEFISFSEGIIFVSLGILHLLNLILAPRILTFFLTKKLNN